jgi:hypothetical protein
MEFILTTGGRSTSPFETWLKSLKELNDSLLINFDFAENSIKSVAYTNDKTCVKRSAISLEEAGFELQAIKSDDGEYIAMHPVESSDDYNYVEVFRPYDIGEH